MRVYKKKIVEYKEVIRKQCVKEQSVQKVIKQSQDVIVSEGNSRMSYFEFLYEQSGFIKKRWWGLQGIVLLVLWLLLRGGGTEYMERFIGILATAFSILIIPEIWKSRKCLAVEIEKTSFYSLRQICAARTLLFGVVDLIMVMLFFCITFHTVQISMYNLIINFLIPFNVSGCICFRLLYSKWMDAEYMAVLGSVVWIVIWSVVVIRDSFYRILAEPLWCGLVLLSFGYMLFLIRKSQQSCEEVWGNSGNGINI